jgi:hypothetical protein
MSVTTVQDPEKIAMDTLLLAEVLTRLAKKGVRQRTVTVLLSQSTGLPFATTDKLLDALFSIEEDYFH